MSLLDIASSLYGVCELNKKAQLLFDDGHVTPKSGQLLGDTHLCSEGLGGQGKVLLKVSLVMCILILASHLLLTALTVVPALDCFQWASVSVFPHLTLADPLSATVIRT